MAYRTLNPATGEVIKEFPYQTEAEVATALTDAHNCYLQDWKRRSIAERSSIVANAARILREKRDEYAAYAVLEMGKLIDEAYYEVDISAAIIEYYASHGEVFLAPRTLPDAPGATLVTEPIGVLLAIEPWNYPYYQLARVAGPQLVAGNVLMVKHARNVPQCALAFARLFEEAGAPVGTYTNLFCSPDQASTLIEDARIRGVTLTGSEQAGRAVGERAGRHLKKAVLELGGSDPALILEDAALEHAIKQCTVGRMMNMGQACAGTKRVIVVGKERGEQMLAGLASAFASLRAGDPGDRATSIGPVNSEAALDDLLDQVKRASEAGARVVVGGKRLDRPGFYMEPTIITGIAEENPLFQEETFGPVLSFYVVETEQEAIRIANATHFGLGASVYSDDIDHAKEIGSHLDCGMVFINSFVYSGPEVPFGGVKNSGFGRELSELGIGEFINRKLVRVA